MRYAVLFLIFAAAAPAAAQSRAHQIAAEFTKSKNATKIKHGVSHHKFKQVVSEPWRASMREYAGRYVSLGDESYLDVAVDMNGAVTARGRDEEMYQVRNARIDDAVLYGTKVYRDGRTEPFEGGFLKRSARSAPDDALTVSYGIGVLVAAPMSAGITGRVLPVFGSTEGRRDGAEI